jgi:hypothetical protein
MITIHAVLTSPAAQISTQMSFGGNLYVRGRKSPLGAFYAFLVCVSSGRLTLLLIA